MDTAREFWNSLLTEKSWKILQELRKKYDFIVIGGWAVYLLTSQQKSKDIDIVIGLKELEKLKAENLGKNERLRKYEIKRSEIDIDIYVEYFSRLLVPAEDIRKYAIKTQGFTVACPETLLILKQAACKDRENSVKGEKDKIDIASLLFLSGIDFKKYNELLKKYKIEFYFNELKKLMVNFKDYNSLNLNPREFKIRKNKLLSELRQQLV